MIVKEFIQKQWKLTEVNMSKTEDFQIPIFDGVNYSIWKKKMLLILDCKGCDSPATRAISDSDDATIWQQQEKRARCLILSAISDKQFEYISDCETAHEILKKFDEIYNVKSTAMQMICRTKIEDVKLKNFDTVKISFLNLRNLAMISKLQVVS